MALGCSDACRARTVRSISCCRSHCGHPRKTNCHHICAAQRCSEKKTAHVRCKTMQPCWYHAGKCSKSFISKGNCIAGLHNNMPMARTRRNFLGASLTPTTPCSPLCRRAFSIWSLSTRLPLPEQHGGASTDSSSPHNTRPSSPSRVRGCGGTSSHHARDMPWLSRSD
jgi:hypothetical protein